MSIYDQWKVEPHRTTKGSMVDLEGGEEDEVEEISPLDVGHNIYILAYKLSEHKAELKKNLDNVATVDAIKYFADHTAQIEVSTSDIGCVYV